MRITVVIIGVKDMKRAVRFYRTALSLPLKFQSAEYSEFKTSGAALALEKRALVRSSGPAFTFQARDINKLRQLLRDRGVHLLGAPKEESYGWVLTARDTEGNTFELVQYKK